MKKFTLFLLIIPLAAEVFLFAGEAPSVSVTLPDVDAMSKLLDGWVIPSRFMKFAGKTVSVSAAAWEIECILTALRDESAAFLNKKKKWNPFRNKNKERLDRTLATQALEEAKTALERKSVLLALFKSPNARAVLRHDGYIK